MARANKNGIYYFPNWRIFFWLYFLFTIFLIFQISNPTEEPWACCLKERFFISNLFSISFFRKKKIQKKNQIGSSRKRKNLRPWHNSVKPFWVFEPLQGVWFSIEEEGWGGRVLKSNLLEDIENSHWLEFISHSVLTSPKVSVTTVFKLDYFMLHPVLSSSVLLIWEKSAWTKSAWVKSLVTKEYEKTHEVTN